MLYLRLQPTLFSPLNLVSASKKISLSEIEVKISFDKKIPTKKEIREQEKLQELIEKRKREAAPRLLREKRMRMRYYPIFLQSEICCEYYLYYLKTRKSILNKRFIKLFKIKPKILETLLTKYQAKASPMGSIKILQEQKEAPI